MSKKLEIQDLRATSSWIKDKKKLAF